MDERVRLSGGGPGSVAPTSGFGGSRRSRSDRDQSTPTDETRADRDSKSTNDTHTAASTPDPSDRHDEPAASTEATATAPSANNTRDDWPETDPAAEDTGAMGADQHVAEADVVATRRIADESIPIGHATRDRIELENKGASAATVTIDIGGSTVDVGQLAPGERTAVERSVGVLAGEGTELTPVTVTVDGEVHKRLSERTIAASGDDVAVRATVDPADGTVVADLVNRDDEPRLVHDLEIASHSVPLEARLEPGAATTVTDRLKDWSRTDTDTLMGSLAITDASGTERRTEIVATVSSTGDGGHDGAGETDPLQITIGPETQVAGEYGTVVLVFEHEGDRPLSDVGVSASGDPINELFYSEARRDRLEPGDRIEHFVDIEPGVSSPSFDATVQYAVNGTDCETTVHAAGPSVEDEAAWTDEHREQWSIERVESESATAETDDVPSALSTPFKLE